MGDPTDPTVIAAELKLMDDNTFVMTIMGGPTSGTWAYVDIPAEGATADPEEGILAVFDAQFAVLGFDNIEIEVVSNTYKAEWNYTFQMGEYPIPLEFNLCNATAVVSLTADATAENHYTSAEIVLYDNNSFEITITSAQASEPKTISGTWTQANQVADIIATFPEGAGVDFGTIFGPITIEIDASGAATGGNIVYAAEWSYSITTLHDIAFSFEGELDTSTLG